MAYATISDIKERYGNDYAQIISDLNNNSTEDAVESTMMTTHLTDAESLIDSYLLRCYLKPTGTIPAVLVAATVDIAVYRIVNTPGRLTHEATKRYTDWMDWLDDVCEKGLAIDGLTETGQEVGVSYAGPVRQWLGTKTNGLYK